MTFPSMNLYYCRGFQGYSWSWLPQTFWSRG